MVEGIERFQPELNISLFPEWKILEYTDGPVLNSGATDNTWGGVTRICLRGRLDHTGVEKTIEGSVASGQVHRTGENAAAIIPAPEKVDRVSELAIQALGKPTLELRNSREPPVVQYPAGCAYILLRADLGEIVYIVEAQNMCPYNRQDAIL